MRKQFKILIILVVITGLGIGGYFGSKVLIQRGEKKAETQAVEYLAKNLTRAEAREAVYGFYELLGKDPPSLKVIAAKELSKKDMSKIHKGRAEKAWPGYKRAWFVQVELENGDYDGHYVVQWRDGKKYAYTKLCPGDPMYRLVVKHHKIIK